MSLGLIYAAFDRSITAALNIEYLKSLKSLIIPLASTVLYGHSSLLECTSHRCCGKVFMR
jgi:hypothetical protein